MRPSRVKIADAPGTINPGANGHCGPCTVRNRTAADPYLATAHTRTCTRCAYTGPLFKYGLCRDCHDVLNPNERKAWKA